MRLFRTQDGVEIPEGGVVYWMHGEPLAPVQYDKLGVPHVIRGNGLRINLPFAQGFFSTAEAARRDWDEACTAPPTQES